MAEALPGAGHLQEKCILPKWTDATAVRDRPNRKGQAWLANAQRLALSRSFLEEDYDNSTTGYPESSQADLSSLRASVSWGAVCTGGWVSLDKVLTREASTKRAGKPLAPGKSLRLAPSCSLLTQEETQNLMPVCN